MFISDCCRLVGGVCTCVRVCWWHHLKPCRSIVFWHHMKQKQFPFISNATAVKISLATFAIVVSWCSGCSVSQPLEGDKKKQKTWGALSDSSVVRFDLKKLMISLFTCTKTLDSHCQTCFHGASLVWDGMCCQCGFKKPFFSSLQENFRGNWITKKLVVSRHDDLIVSKPIEERRPTLTGGKSQPAAPQNRRRLEVQFQ